MLLSLSIAPILLVAVAVLFVYKYFFWSGFLSPLARIPGAHPIAPYSSLWILWTRYRKLELQTIHQAHLKHGPIVRLGPSELSVNCVDGGIRTIYSGGFDKHDWYPNIFENYGYPNMFATAQGKPHSIRRRMLSNVYAKSYLQASPALGEVTTSILYKRVLPHINAAVSSNSVVNVFEFLSAVTLDLVTCFKFGLSVGSNLIQDQKACRRFVKMYHDRHSYAFFRQEIPLLTRILEKAGISLVPRFVSVSNEELEAQCLNMCDAADEILNQEGKEGSKGDHPSVYAQLRASLTAQRKSGTEAPLPFLPSNQRLEIASELLDQSTAGFETSTITLTYLIWELSTRPVLQSDLRAELRTVEPAILIDPTAEADGTIDVSTPASPSSLPWLNHKAIDALPILHAIVMETLRRHPAIPGPQPRITPSTPCSLAGYAGIPPGVRVSAQAYSLHRNEDVFPEAESWKPERWLDASEHQLKEMQRWFWAFGSGGRMCVGSNLAMLQMKAIIAIIYASFTTSIADDTGIEQEFAYSARPKGKQLMIQFAKVKQI